MYTSYCCLTSHIQAIGILCGSVIQYTLFLTPENPYSCITIESVSQISNRATRIYFQCFTTLSFLPLLVIEMWFTPPNAEIIGIPINIQEHWCWCWYFEISGLLYFLYWLGLSATTSWVIATQIRTSFTGPLDDVVSSHLHLHNPTKDTVLFSSQ